MKTKTKIIPEIKPDDEKMARHAVRIRFKGKIARDLGLNRGDLIRIRTKKETIYRVVIFDLYMREGRIRMDYDSMLELGISKGSVPSDKKEGGVEYEVEILKCVNNWHNLMYLLDHPDPNTRLAVKTFAWGLVLAVATEELLTLLNTWIFG